MNIDWHKLNEDMSIAYVFPCDRVYAMRLKCFVCKEPYQGHGHVVLDTYMGWAVIPFPIQSKAGLEKVLEVIAASGDDFEKAGCLLLTMPEIKILPKTFSPNELRILASIRLFNTAMRMHFNTP